MSLSGEPIVILGSYRSGTSSVSTALVKLGLYMGDDGSLFPADEFNPDGHWELKDMMAAHERVLNGLRTSYHATMWLPENWSDLPFATAMVADLAGLLKKHFDGRSNWGWKEPATSILLPLYQEALRREGAKPRYLICVRHPRSVVASMMKRFVQSGNSSWAPEARDQPGTEERFMSMWLSYTLASLHDTISAPRSLICYERYLQDPREHVETIGRLLTPWKPTEEQIVTAATTVKPQLSHANFKADEGLKDWPSIIADTYDLALRADADPDEFANGAFDDEIKGLWAEWLRFRRMIQAPTLPPSQFRFAWGDQQERVVNFSPAGGWQSIEAELPSSTQVFADPYTGPCRVWISRAKWNGQDISISAGPGGMMEDIAGKKRLSILGPHSLAFTTPNEPGKVTIECLFQSNEQVLATMVSAAAKQGK